MPYTWLTMTLEPYEVPGFARKEFVQAMDALSAEVWSGSSNLCHVAELPSLGIELAMEIDLHEGFEPVDRKDFMRTIRNRRTSYYQEMMIAAAAGLQHGQRNLSEFPGGEGWPLIRLGAAMRPDLLVTAVPAESAHVSG
jgi:hypothetical protein